MIHGYLVLQKKSGKEGPLFPVKNDLRIGRGIDCDVRIHIQSVSNHHCLVTVGEGVKARIINLSSTSRTLVNGMPVKSQGCTLTHGDSITVGERLFRWYEGQKIPLKKRRKSEADTLIRSHNIAVVTPLHHKRRTVGPAAASGLWCGAPKTPSRTPSKVGRTSSKKLSLKVSHTPSAKTPVSKTPTSKTSAAKTPTAKTPASKTPAAKTSTSKTPTAKTPVSKTPVSKTPAAKTPVSKTPTAKTPASKTPAAKTPASKTPAAKTPVSKTPAARASVGKSPTTAVPEGKASGTRTPARKSSVSGTPRDRSITASSPAMKTSAVKSSVSRLGVGKSPSTQSPAAKSPVRKTPAGKSIVRTPRAKSLSLNTSEAKASSMSRRSSSGKASKTSGTPKPVKLNSVQKSKNSKGQKRRLSSPYAVASKRVKIESPKSIDKKKMAALSGIHRKSLNIARSSTLATVRVVLSSKKTPIVKALKTPRGSTLKKKNQEPKSSIKKARRPLFSEIVKKKAVQIANAAAKKSLQVSKEPLKASKQLLPQSALSTEIPPKFSFSSRSNRHANSPEPIFIGRKTAKTPQVTRKGRKDPLVFMKKTLKENINLSGVSDMFKTPGKLNLEKSRQSEGMTSSSKLSITSNLSASPALRESSGSSINRSKRSAKKLSLSSSPMAKTATPVATPKLSPKLSKSGLESSYLKENSHGASAINSSSITSRSLKSISPELKNTPESSKNLPRSSRKSNAVSAVSASKLVKKSFSEILPTSPAASPIGTPSSRSRSQVLGSLGAKRGVSLLTSTPAAVGRRQPSVGSAYESPSSLLTAQTSSPQSPASGRKSRLDVVEKIVPFIYSPHASPGKSSLKTSPSRSPPSGGHGKGLSVSFSDNIHVQMLLSVSKKGNKTAVTRSSSISPISEGSNSVRTPDLTTFDFNSIKTPNVPKEMFVSSILSSGASSNSMASGSAKRKGRAPRSPQSEVSNLQVRRFLKSTASPSGYVDVKGVKRLMAASCRTPTYLAVEGVKKLFGDAAAAAGNELSNFAGVRELFASPSPKIKSQGRLPAKETPEVTSLKQTSPVAKILAEVEGKKAPSFTSQAPALRGGTPASSSRSIKTSPPPSVTSQRSRSTDVASSKKSPSVAKSEDSVAVEKTTPVRSTRNAKRLPKKKAAEENLTQKLSPSRIEKSEVKASPIQKRTRKAAKVFSPSAIQSPPKRTTRRAAKSAKPTKMSPVSTKSSNEDKTGKSPSFSESKPSGRSTKQTIQATKQASQDSPSKTTPAKKVTRRAAVKRHHSVSPIPSPVKSPAKASKKVKITTKASSPVEEPQPKGRTRRGAKANSTVQPDSTSTKAKSIKRVLSSPVSGSESPSKKSKQETVKLASPQNSSPKRGATRRTRKVPSPVKTSSTEQSTSLNAGPKSSKRKKIVSFEEESASPAKKSRRGATTSAHVTQSSEQVTPEKIKGSKRTARSSKKSSPQKVSVSPRRTRSRK